ncbi:hypothetical protein [Tellurirhabdus bombi]|uniref:hypothetical protein n=1 Tax=Tellurirhabdus bombi TaxID=2907205 RepID=UPI001F1B1D87|nr:hypothetical protein [Tellurirhabdus bombi]
MATELNNDLTEEPTTGAHYPSDMANSGYGGSAAAPNDDDDLDLEDEEALDDDDEEFIDDEDLEDE